MILKEYFMILLQLKYLLQYYQKGSSLARRSLQKLTIILVHAKSPMIVIWNKMGKNHINFLSLSHFHH